MTAALREAAFSSPNLPVRIAADTDRLPVPAGTVVVNLATTDARVHGVGDGYVPAHASTILGDCQISGELLALIEAPRGPVDEAFFRDSGWIDFFASETNDPSQAQSVPVLLRSDRDQVGTVQLRLDQLLHDENAPVQAVEHTVWLNLWFSPANTDCGIHREHDFVETHTQVLGDGRMQRFTGPEGQTVIEEQLLRPGMTQPILFTRWQDTDYVYPWHQYRADTDCVWLAIEYHRQDR